MLSSCIHEPLLLEEALDREINAIDEEYQMYFEQNTVLMMQVMAKHTTEGNLFNRFIWGSKESLTEKDD